ncbi:MAG: hypothetical protein GF313_06360 [Caldithrix sp.]|nr:hypothetical protein [Caldithrix sp.]
MNGSRAKTVLIFILLMLTGQLNAQTTIKSPDDKLQITIQSSASVPLDRVQQNQLHFTIEYANQVIVNPSPFTLKLQDGQIIGQSSRLLRVDRQHNDQQTALLYGKSRQFQETFNETHLLFETGNSDKWLMECIVRVYNDAVAMRMRFPQQKDKVDFIIVDEHMHIRLPYDGLCYALPLRHFRTSYENNYSIKKLSELPYKQLFGVPFLTQLKSNLWLAVTEADLANYSGMYLVKPDNSSNTLLSRLAPSANDSGYAVKGKIPKTLPWRVFMIGEHPGGFIESEVILSLAKPSKIEDPSWIKPGKVVWPWWSNRVVNGRKFEGGMNTKTMKYYIDFAAENQIKYVLIDAEWYGKHDTDEEDITTTIPQIDMPHILDYAKQNGVGVWLWLNWQCVRDQMDKAFPLYESWGIKGIKVDYMNRDDQAMVQFYKKVLQTAAKHRLMVNFHGAYKPTGLRRTYPNLLTREGVLGLEYSKWSTSCNPEHDIILPFTRMLAGPMDYTPGAFQVANKENFKAQFTAPMAMGTRAHQLAMYVIFESALQMLVDHPASYFGETGFEFLTDVPVTWDEKRFIDGQVGAFVIIARRKGEQWYLGAMTNWTARNIPIPLDFLGEGRYYADIYADARDTYGHVVAERKVVDNMDDIKLVLDSGGGCAVKFKPTW